MRAHVHVCSRPLNLHSSQIMIDGICSVRCSYLDLFCLSASRTSSQSSCISLWWKRTRTTSQVYKGSATRRGQPLVSRFLAAQTYCRDQLTGERGRFCASSQWYWKDQSCFVSPARNCFLGTDSESTVFRNVLGLLVLLFLALFCFYILLYCSSLITFKPSFFVPRRPDNITTSKNYTTYGWKPRTRPSRRPKTLKRSETTVLSHTAIPSFNIQHINLFLRRIFPQLIKVSSR